MMTTMTILSSSIALVDAYISATHKAFSSYTPSWSLYANDAVKEDVPFMSLEAIRRELDALNVPHKFGTKERLEQQLLDARQQRLRTSEDTIKPLTPEESSFVKFLTQSDDKAEQVAMPNKSSSSSSSSYSAASPVFPSTINAPPPHVTDSHKRKTMRVHTEQESLFHQNDATRMQEGTQAFQNFYESFKTIEFEMPRYEYQPSMASRIRQEDVIDVEFSYECST